MAGGIPTAPWDCPGGGYPDLRTAAHVIAIAEGAQAYRAIGV